ncbi:MAG: hypothetical protein HXS54_08365 [Theionarchaea archaeon]|nr:hypothetical protein [Theionarchaea archaeon]
MDWSITVVVNGDERMVDCQFGVTVFMMGVIRNKIWQIEHVSSKGGRGHSFGQFRFPIQDMPAGDLIGRDYNEVGPCIN